jgi:arylformamidase
MKIIDISLTISPNLVVWPGDPPVHMERTSKMEEGEVANVTSLRLGAHTGTHMDAPRHFVHDARTVDQIGLEELIGKVQVINIPPGETHITKQVLEAQMLEPDIDRVLFRTTNSDLWAANSIRFDTGYVGLNLTGAQYLVEKGIRVIGIDYLSAAAYDCLTEVHQLLLSKNIILLEGLDLSAVDPGLYLLVCMPLKLKDSDGAPMRAALVSGDLFN